MERKTLRLTVPDGQAAIRLDRFLGETGEELSRTLAKKLIDLGGVHVNGRRVRQCSLMLAPADRVVVHVDGLPLTPYTLDEQDVVFRDKHLLVVDKPAGVDVQPTPSRYKGTLYAAVTDYLRNPLRRDLAPSVGMVQRLDRDTSGLVVFSIHPAAHKELSRQFVERLVVKGYRAIVAGRIEHESGEFSSELARRRASNTMRSVAKGGRQAITRYRLLAATDVASLVDVAIPTGRSHQIRAHFSEAGHPLLGDVRYGGPGGMSGVPIGRQMLHACSLTLSHPVSGDKLEFQSELPADMKRIVSHLFQDLP